MKRLLQSLLLGLYKFVKASGVLSTTWGSAMFEWGYHRYKRLLEAGDIRRLSSFIQPGTVVIDVGANIGFFTKFFGDCVRPSGRVIAIEPEQVNFSRLSRMVQRSGLNQVVETIQAVAAEKSGTLRLAINPEHPADHKIAEAGVPVKAVVVDELLAERDWPRVSLIKIDVQGAEVMVLRGSRETLRRFHPVLYLEVDDEGLRAMQADAEGLFRMLQEQGYAIHRIIKGKLSAPMKVQESVVLCQGGKYADFLFLHPQTAVSAGSSDG
jgi:FkbM family methyltransferase